MRYAFMSFSCPQLSLTESLALARRLGYDGFEPRVAGGHQHGIELSLDAEGRRNVRRQSEAHGVALACLSSGCHYADPANLAENVTQTLALIDLAADVGAPCLRVFGGKIGAELDRVGATAQVVEALQRVAPRARQRGVTLCMETHDDWCHADDLARVMQGVNDPVLGVTWDMMHPVRTGGQTMEHAFRTLKPWIRHVHIHDGLLDQSAIVFRPLGQGQFDLKTFFRCLHEVSYGGYLSGEWIGCEQIINLGDELTIMRELEASTRNG